MKALVPALAVSGTNWKYTGVDGRGCGNQGCPSG